MSHYRKSLFYELLLINVEIHHLSVYRMPKINNFLLSTILISVVSFGYEYLIYASSMSENYSIYVHKSQIHSQIQFLVTFCFITSLISFFIKDEKTSRYLYLISLFVVPLLYLFLFFNYYKTNQSIEIPYTLTTLLSNSFGLLDVFFLLISLGLISYSLINKEKVSVA